MVDAEIEETLTLEYEASPALKRENDEVRKLCKDVSAMANSELLPTVLQTFQALSGMIASSPTPYQLICDGHC